ncbi:glycosyltransferase family 2 protein [Blautia sp. NSJ-175]|uniref:glycosyltransferase n=1 Tax=Blautia sp. NSJ-175 TaxID=2931396 RepID=UPI001FD01DF9|nr:glycosyltransferase family 2 protein [Blautia sp. NSJ-175]MCJ7849002.1 glycosyltransferase family 2 protein [Blautia sp. NSJ-175]
MKIVVVILNYKTYEMTLKLIKNIERIKGNEKVDIVVVDNASPNESADILRTESNDSHRFALLKNDINSGYAAGNNVGIKYAVENGAEYILVSNNDIELDTYDGIKKMIELMNSNTKIGAISPRIVSKNGKKDPPLYFRRPSFWDMTFGIVTNHKERFRFDDAVDSKIYAPRGSFMLLRATDMKKIGFLDEGTFLYYEEPILSERLSRIGKECWLCGNAEVIHNHGKTISTSIKKKQTCNILCKSLSYYLKNYRNYNCITRFLCVKFRELSYMIRR